MAEKTGWVQLEKTEDDISTCITTAMQSPTGTIVRTYTIGRDPKGSYHGTETTTFIPGVMLKQQDDKTWQFHFP